MDPACGSGNFLIVTYKQLRQLEIDILKEQNNLGYQTMYLPSVTLDQFYGIEIDDFACDTTRLSLWIAEHQMNVKLHEEIQDAVRPTLPLQHAGAIVCGNALRIDWNEVMPHTKDEEVYLFGNPPYIGSRNQTSENKADLKYLFSKIKSYKKLDYVCSWYFKGARYISNTNAELSFVTTNSIFQGEQVSILWPLVFNYNVDFSFAYTSFRWSNNAKNNAGVVVAIAGLKSIRKNREKKLFSNGMVKIVKNISPYLTEGGSVIIRKANSRYDNLPKLQKGNAAYDNGFFTFSVSEYLDFLNRNPESKTLFKKYISASDFINGKFKYCLWIDKTNLDLAMNIPEVVDRMKKVEEYRKNSKREVTRKAAETPYEFGEIRWKETQAIIIPVVSSDLRYYVPIGYINDDIITSYATFVIYDAPLWLMGILESRMHMIWLKTLSGRLGTDYRYSAGLIYNTFPIPFLSDRRKKEIGELVLNILDIRNEEGGTLADLYGSPLAEKNPKPMNTRLLAAHKELDQVVERAYKDRPFKNDNERLSLLLDMHNKKIKETKDN